MFIREGSKVITPLDLISEATEFASVTIKEWASGS